MEQYEIDVKACFDFVQANAQKLGFAKGEIIRIEAKLKSVKAALVEDSDASSVAMKEHYAHRHVVYLEVINELAQATAEECRLGILLKAAFFKIETHRAQMYLTRQEIKNGL